MYIARFYYSIALERNTRDSCLGIKYEKPVRLACLRKYVIIGDLLPRDALFYTVGKLRVHAIFFRIARENIAHRAAYFPP